MSPKLKIKQRKLILVAVILVVCSAIEASAFRRPELGLTENELLEKIPNVERTTRGEGNTHGEYSVGTALYKSDWQDEHIRFKAYYLFFNDKLQGVKLVPLSRSDWGSIIGRITDELGPPTNRPTAPIEYRGIRSGGDGCKPILLAWQKKRSLVVQGRMCVHKDAAEYLTVLESLR